MKHRNAIRTSCLEDSGPCFPSGSIMRARTFNASSAARRAVDTHNVAGGKKLNVFNAVGYAFCFLKERQSTRETSITFDGREPAGQDAAMNFLFSSVSANAVLSINGRPIKIGKQPALCLG